MYTPNKIAENIKIRFAAFLFLSPIFLIMPVNYVNQPI
jgi:hypothetical protein